MLCNNNQYNGTTYYRENLNDEDRLSIKYKKLVVGGLRG